MGSCWWFSGLYPRAYSHAENEELENSTHARETRAGTKAGDSLVVLWTVPACVPARGEEELENSTHARGTRAGTYAGDSSVVLWTVPACVLARGEEELEKFLFPPAGRGRETGVCPPVAVDNFFKS